MRNSTQDFCQAWLEYCLFSASYVDEKSTHPHDSATDAPGTPTLSKLQSMCFFPGMAGWRWRPRSSEPGRCSAGQRRRRPPLGTRASVRKGAPPTCSAWTLSERHARLEDSSHVYLRMCKAQGERWGANMQRQNALYRRARVWRDTAACQGKPCAQSEKLPTRSALVSFARHVGLNA